MILDVSDTTCAQEKCLQCYCHGATDTRPGLLGMACVKADLKCLNLTKGAVSK